MAKQTIIPYTMVELTESQVNVPTGVSTQLLAVNNDRGPGSWVQNNTNKGAWLSHSGVAADGQGIYLNRGGIYYFSSRQSLHAYQSSGGAIDLDIVEATT